MSAPDFKAQLTDHLRDLHLPAVRRCFEEKARHAESETLSYERYLFELIELECQERRQHRIPTDLKEVCDVYHLSRVERWRRLILPGIFPYLITGFVTASGGAWNASIVAEYCHFHGPTVTATGLGAVISRATDAGDFPTLLAATIVMASIVVTINRLLWRRLYALASGRYSMNG